MYEITEVELAEAKLAARYGGGAGGGVKEGLPKTIDCSRYSCGSSEYSRTFENVLKHP